MNEDLITFHGHEGGNDGGDRHERLPPHSRLAERGVLGCCLLDAANCLGQCVEAFGGEQMFYELTHSAIYLALVGMWNAQQPVDTITVHEELQSRGLLEEVGGLSYISQLADAVPSAGNLPFYLEIVREKFWLRRMLQVCGEVQRRVWEWQGNAFDVRQLMDEVERDVLAVNSLQNVAAAKDMRALVAATIDRMETMSRGVGMLGGLRTHFGYYDKMTGGMHRKEMIVLAGRPGTGKTSRAMNVAANIALREKLPVGVFSLEMSAEDLTMRLVCAEAEVNFHKIRTGFIAAEDYPKLTVAAARVAAAPIHIDDTAGLSILALRAKARRMASRHGIQLVVIDYLQLMNGGDRYRGKDNRQQEIAEISGGVKALAKELNVPVLVLSQLNRESAKSRNRKPQLEDLRESGAIEQDADLVELLYRPRSEDGDDEEAEEFPVRGFIAKQRNGPTGDVEYFFKRTCMKFVDAYANRGRQVMPTDQELGVSGTRSGEWGARKGGGA